ncbi:MAG TPA: phosphotransferase [Ktedonobacteraceae bacterium]
MMDEQNPVVSHLTIQDLPQIVRELFARTRHELLPGATRPADLFVRYLRRKPGRGLAVIYDASERLPHQQRSSAVHRAISLTLGEQALAGSSIRITSAQARATSLEQASGGIVQSPELDLALQAFPADSSLPRLADCCSTRADSPLLEYLQEAGRLFLRDESWQLFAARAFPVRYKPASRCVIRYALTLTQPDAGSEAREVSIFGKVYADVAQARTVQGLTRQLYAEQTGFQGTTVAGFTQQAPFLPRTLAFIENAGLVLTEAVQPAMFGGKLRTGTSVLQPQIVQTRGGKTASTQPPASELRLAAIALARLHTSQVSPGQHTLRPGSKEAKRARERAALLTGYYPKQAEQIQDLVQTLAQRLETLHPATYRPAHGGFKASQLLYLDDTISVVDFDGFCLADPALDVGYFLAYLRPSGLWYERQGARAWFEAAAEIFTITYTRALQELGVFSEEATGILRRSHTYTAALLFKIATRRVNRLNSPRPQELAGILRDIASSLSI